MKPEENHGRQTSLSLSSAQRRADVSSLCYTSHCLQYHVYKNDVYKVDLLGTVPWKTSDESEGVAYLPAPWPASQAALFLHQNH
ncbi:hypothetical protein Pcinc_036726 [Petrolisthes cinctipes]|uniref:Uncharacterized protein n=1 Tax=Petrolisthes cinctipes TaxID=88211 RepID=A0AAE1BU89_PETCI|nr:hypothetical protein Pcinc_036726 [Petrolisthes cinctipes]